MSKTTLDLSTLPDISDGTHTVKVKAKADGYRDSEFSNEVSYTKASIEYTYSVTNSKYSTSDRYQSGRIVLFEQGASTAIDGGYLEPGDSYYGHLSTNKIIARTYSLNSRDPDIVSYDNCSYEIDTDHYVIITANSPDKTARIEIKSI